MKFYVAAHDRLLASLVADVITRAGHDCTSTWINNEFLPTENHTVKERMSIAFEDVDDVCRSDVLVLVAGAEKYSGGKFVEAGIAIGRNIPVIVIGRRENMLLWYHAIMSVETAEMAAKVISNMESHTPSPETRAEGNTDVQHHTAEPRERTIAQAYCDDPRVAIRRAIRANDTYAETCVACGEVLHDGDTVYFEPGEEGHIHSHCAGGDPNSFVNEDGKPLTGQDPLPEPFRYMAGSD